MTDRDLQFTFTGADLDQLRANVDATIMQWAAGHQQTPDPNPDPDPDPVPGTPLHLDPEHPTTTTPGGTATIHWLPNPARQINGFHVERGGKDSTGHGIWDEFLPADATNYTFQKLIPGAPYDITVTAFYDDDGGAGDGEETLTTTVTVPVLPPQPGPDPTPGRTTWNTGVWAEHDLDQARGWFAWTGRQADPTARNVAVFTSRETERAMVNNWWASRVPGGSRLVLGVPLCPDNDRDLSKPRPGLFETIAKQASAVDPDAVVRFGWEMNLKGWPWALTEANLQAWRGAWIRGYDAFKATNPRLSVVFNPNGGDLNSTGVNLMRALVEGKVDAVGPDQYDGWPGMVGNTAADLASNINLMMDRPGGLRWWMNTANSLGLPLIVPEWGVWSGSAWAGHAGGDNPVYIRTMRAFFAEAAKTGKGLMLESYFNSTNTDHRTDIYRLPGRGAPSNPKSAALYRELWAER